MHDTVEGLLARLKRPLLYVMGVLYVAAGLMHFVVPGLYAQIIPPVFPAPLTLVYLSGLAEIALGLGVMIPRTRRIAAWGLVALLIAIFPANIYMATSNVVLVGAPEFLSNPSTVGRWGRLPFQAVFILWAWWYTRPMPDGTD